MLLTDKIVLSIINNLKTFNVKLYIYMGIFVFLILSYFIEYGLSGLLWLLALVYAFALWSMLLIDMIFNIKKYGLSTAYILFVIFTLLYFGFLVYENLEDIIVFILGIGTLMFLITISLGYFMKWRYK